MTENFPKIPEICQIVRKLTTIVRVGESEKLPYKTGDLLTEAQFI